MKPHTPQLKTIDMTWSFLIQEFFDVVCEMEPLFAKYNSPQELIENTNEEISENLYKVCKFISLSLEVYNCTKRFFETFPLSTEKRPGDLSKLFLNFTGEKEKLDSFIKDFLLEVVFTAHPTEVFPLSVIKTFNRIEVLIEKLYNSKSPERRYRILQALRAHFASLWKTEETYQIKPTPLDEADRLLHIFKSSIWKVTPYFNRRFYWEYKKTFNSAPSHYPKLKFSSWVGGDRDGNPFVTADITKTIIVKTRVTAIKLVLREIKALRDEIFAKDASKSLVKLYPNDLFPYQSLFADLAKHLQKALQTENIFNVDHLEKYIQEKLKIAFNSLNEIGLKRVADRRLRSLIDRIRTFGLAPLSLDLRQDSEVHSAIIDELKTYSENLDPKVLLKVSFSKLSEEAQDFFKTIALAKQFTPNPFNVYVISMTRTAQDLKNLRLLLSLGQVDLPIAPLFETPEDIRQSSKIMEEAEDLNIPQIMWGYSDSTKKGGRFASAWNLYSEQSKFVEKGFTHFHGRGGSIARGGGTMENVFRLLPPGLIGKHFRQTFQGEVIQDEFGLPLRALRTLEKILMCSAENHCSPKSNMGLDKKNILNEFSNTSESEFKKTFYEDMEFIQDFESNTPISIISKMNMGSRPQKRSTGSKVPSYRAIPWVFSWTQTRGFLPLWYGMEEKLPQIKLMQGQHIFLKAFLDLIKEGLYYSDTTIYQKYFEGDLYKKLGQQLDTIKESLIIPVPGPSLQKDLAQFLHGIQIHGLKNKPEEEGLHEDILKITVQGIASYIGRSG